MATRIGLSVLFLLCAALTAAVRPYTAHAATPTLSGFMLYSHAYPTPYVNGQAVLDAYGTVGAAGFAQLHIDADAVLLDVAPTLDQPATQTIRCTFTRHTADCTLTNLHAGGSFDITIVESMPATPQRLYTSAMIVDSSGNWARRVQVTDVLPLPTAPAPTAAFVGLSNSSYQDARAPSCPVDVRYWNGVCPVPMR